jgi:CO/xanthine dehydrogenase Mo-binding subunit
MSGEHEDLGPVGSFAPRSGGRERVTGMQRYVADLEIPDALHVKLVTVDAARARIGRIDAAAALAIPGVRAVFTAADLPLRPPAPRPPGDRRR